MEDFATPPEGDAPIILGDALPMDTDFAAPATDGFAIPPSDDPFVGTIDETPADAPIVLGAAPVETGQIEDVDEVEESQSGPSPMQQWNEEWQNLLVERKDAENAKKAELIAAAEESMKNFQDQRESKRESKLSKNRSDEQEKLEAIEADLENDNSWQRVCKMVELSHESGEDSVDVKRMRDVMILLKNEPSRASVLA
mmetsp:Transcript_2529/g.3722  ORF Transcript_2529/g.3722 Transcript_2529/m.3722 type:complete len:198 (-) Transcript_2529:175-768(-)|eukprot:CAMPEP_0194210674 /NCGR_PEP_ID=MMETSP0156-20130528/8943_1 /TAXON_ID=33649 /ORGANISM="Thalassionema nitzschioides, Strain L26-B" /LENGTH=197 /DNA_ID=CAMNT_0038938047 /DNA_START=55 /DNA_END=648 /DNA_ORIENTATION=-